MSEEQSDRQVVIEAISKAENYLDGMMADFRLLREIMLRYLKKNDNIEYKVTEYSYKDKQGREVKDYEITLCGEFIIDPRENTVQKDIVIKVKASKESVAEFWIENQMYMLMNAYNCFSNMFTDDEKRIKRVRRIEDE